MAIHFVPQEELWQEVEEQVRLRQAGPVLRRSLVNLWGAPGSGKSVFLRWTFWERLVRYYPDLPKVFLDFDPKSQVHQHQYQGWAGPGELTLSLAVGLERNALRRSPELSEAGQKWISQYQLVKGAERTGRPKPTELVLAENELAQAWVNWVSGSTSKLDLKPLVVVLDTVDELSWELMGFLQEKLIEPTCRTGKVFCLLASRVPVHCQPYTLREFFQWQRMPSLTQEELTTMLTDFSPSQTEQIQALSFGLPAAVVALAEALAEKAGGDDLVAAFVLKGLLLENTRGLGRATEDIRQAIWLLSAVRLIRLEQISGFLPALLPEYFANRAVGSNALTIIQQIAQTRLVFWDHSRQGNIIVPPYRGLLAFLLEKLRPELFYQAQERAVAFYLRLAQLPYQERRVDWLVEACFHQAQLLRLNKEENLSAQLGFWLTDQLSQVYPGSFLAELGQVQIPQLRGELALDAELNELLAGELLVFEF